MNSCTFPVNILLRGIHALHCCGHCYHACNACVRVLRLRRCWIVDDGCRHLRYMLGLETIGVTELYLDHNLYVSVASSSSCRHCSLCLHDTDIVCPSSIRHAGAKYMSEGIRMNGTLRTVRVNSYRLAQVSLACLCVCVLFCRCKSKFDTLLVAPHVRTTSVLKVSCFLLCCP